MSNSFSSYDSKEAVAQRCWDALMEVRKDGSLVDAVLEEMRFEGDDPPANVRSFLDEFAMRCWKCGFHDALFAIESGSLVIHEPGNN